MGGDPTTCWLPRVFDGRVMLFGYDIDDSFSYLCTFEGILSRARILLENLRSLRDDTKLSKRPIHLVSNDLGGLLVKAVRSQKKHVPSDDEVLELESPIRVSLYKQFSLLIASD